MSMRCRMTGPSCVTLCVLLSAACTGGSPQDVEPTPPRRASHSTTTHPAADPAQIDLHGASNAPLHWKVPDVQADEQQAVRAARRYIALVETMSASRHPARLATTLLPTVTHGDLLEQDLGIWADGGLNEDHRVGPIWVWVRTVHRHGSRATLRICKDLGWNTPLSETSSRPRPPNLRSEALVYTVRLLAGNGPTQRWKVMKSASWPPKPVCRRWRHRAPDPGRLRRTQGSHHRVDRRCLLDLHNPTGSHPRH